VKNASHEEEPPKNHHRPDPTLSEGPCSYHPEHPHRSAVSPPVEAQMPASLPPLPPLGLIYYGCGPSPEDRAERHVAGPLRQPPPHANITHRTSRNLTRRLRIVRRRRNLGVGLGVVERGLVLGGVAGRGEPLGELVVRHGHDLTPRARRRLHRHLCWTDKDKHRWSDAKTTRTYAQEVKRRDRASHRGACVGRDLARTGRDKRGIDGGGELVKMLMLVVGGGLCVCVLAD
jgi:hypothetical protein